MYVCVYVQMYVVVRIKKIFSLFELEFKKLIRKNKFFIVSDSFKVF